MKILGKPVCEVYKEFLFQQKISHFCEIKKTGRSEKLNALGIYIESKIVGSSNGGRKRGAGF